MAGFAVVVVILVALLVSGIIWLADTLAGPMHPWALGPIVLLLLVGLLVARVVRGVRQSVVPLGELIEASARVEAGQFGTQVAERGSGEVRTLARAFNAMSARLAETEEQRRALLAEVSHELRTPLTVIQGNVEGMLDGLYPADRVHLERVQAETRHLEQLIEDLRTLSLADAGALPLHREPSDLGEIARDVVAGFEPQASAAAVSLALEAPDDLPEMEVDPRRIHQVIANLVSNALRHTPEGGRVTVSVQAERDAVILAVADTGSGMTADAVTHAFDRFWRSGESAGAGLGLAIVRDLVRAHGGEASISSTPGNGTMVRCTFPRALG
jgi:signal transduction histidine kinase